MGDFIQRQTAPFGRDEQSEPVLSLGSGAFGAGYEDVHVHRHSRLAGSPPRRSGRLGARLGGSSERRHRNRRPSGRRED